MILLICMRTDKNLAFDLRKQGKTYRQIESELGIARSTLSEWFRDVEWSRHWVQKNNTQNIEASTERIKLMNKGRRIKLDAWYENLDREAESEFQIYKKDSLFAAGLMLYAGEGSKNESGCIKMANTDFDLHRIFLAFVTRYLESSFDKIKFSLLLYPDLILDACLEKWSKELGISRENFYKTQVIQGRHKTRKLQFGVGTTILVGIKYQRKLLKWIELYKRSL